MTEIVTNVYKVTRNLHKMTKVTAFLLKSFGVDETGGNPAGVVLNTENLSVEHKKAISKAINYSETAFVEHSDKADYKVRFLPQ